uniref:Uncharacterized protein n=1 Tax=Astyanax mexicanus TaxID=7994 RepID=A0A3B1IGU5_ASTMX
KQQEKRRGTSRGCKREEGTLIHMFWSCPCVVPFWKSITEHLSNITNVNIPLSPRLMILGDTSVLINNRFNLNLSLKADQIRTGSYFLFHKHF